MFIIYQIGRMSIIMYLPCMVLASLTGINVNILILIMGVIAIIYSYTGGLKSVLWTDFIQGSVLIVGMSFALHLPAEPASTAASAQSSTPSGPSTSSWRPTSRFLMPTCCVTLSSS